MIALEYEAYGVVTVRIPIPVAVLLGASALYYQVAGSILIQAAYNVEQRRFAATRRTEYGNKLALPEF